MEWINTIASAITSIFTTSQEIKKLKYSIREQKKRKEVQIKLQYQRIFAQASVAELSLMKKLVESNNAPQRITDNDEVPYSSACREVVHNDVEENLYQILSTEKAYYPYNYDYDTPKVELRITVPVFETFKKEFLKHGIQRLPNKKNKEKAAK